MVVDVGDVLIFLIGCPHLYQGVWIIGVLGTLTCQLHCGHVSIGDPQLRSLGIKYLECQLMRLVSHTQAVLEAGVSGAGVHEAARKS